jgi:hypothetical protein
LDDLCGLVIEVIHYMSMNLEFICDSVLMIWIASTYSYQACMSMLDVFNSVEFHVLMRLQRCTKACMSGLCSMVPETSTYKIRCLSSNDVQAAGMFSESTMKWTALKQ